MRESPRKFILPLHNRERSCTTLALTLQRIQHPVGLSAIFDP